MPSASRGSGGLYSTTDDILIGAFAAVNAFDIDAGLGLARMVNELVADLAAP